MKIKEFFIKLGTFILPVFGGILGALGGADNSNKALRRIMIPFSLTGFAYVNLENIWVITIMSMCGVFSLGYGLPGPSDPKPSKLGEFFFKLCKQNHFWANTVTRTLIGILTCLSLISIPFIKYNWLVYGLCSLGIILTDALISWRNLGQYTLFNRKLNWSETLLYGLITLFAILIIKL